MKPTTLLLAVTLTANAAFVAIFTFRPALLPPAWREPFVSDATRATDLAVQNKSAADRATAQARAAASQRAKTWASLNTGDLRTLVARLRAAGFSPAVIRAIVGARIEESFAARMSELLGSVDSPFWKPDPFSSSQNPKFYEAQNQIYRDRTKALREILGDDYFAGSAIDATTAQRRQFGDLPKSKIELVQRIVDDYAEMNSQVKAAGGGITLPEDREKFDLLEREKRADLATILTPAEVEDYEMRNSTVTSRLRTGLTIMDASAAEFAAIFRAQQPFAELLYPNYSGSISISFSSETSRQRTEAQKQIADQLRAALGEPRYADYARATSYDYQSLYRLAQRDNIPVDAINRAYDLRAATADESTRINDAKLSPADRSAALQALAASTKAKLAGALGATVADAYVKSASWLTAIQNGHTIRLSPDGQLSIYIGSAPPSPKK